MGFSSQKWYTIAGAVSVLAFLLDRLTKYWALELKETIVLIPDLLQLRYIGNERFAFYFSVHPGVLYSITIIVLLLFVYLGYQEYLAKHQWNVGIMLVVFVGAFSNLLDRIYYGAVIDFIDVPFWSVFNLADIYIVGGVLAVFLLMARKEEKSVE